MDRTFADWVVVGIAVAGTVVLMLKLATDLLHIPISLGF